MEAELANECLYRISREGRQIGIGQPTTFALGLHWVAARATVERSHQLRINKEDVLNRKLGSPW